ncbi:helix-turn-helix domain-containing protein, partial [Escherichia coli]|nr:helix-turn-helix domain-containing protein [Escherichia coli]
QRACLLAAAEGQSAKQAARSIDLTPRTVQHHHEEARRRLGARSLTHAVALALRDGMIT